MLNSFQHLNPFFVTKETLKQIQCDGKCHFERSREQSN